jgi:cytochrome c oxidase subunit 3
MLLRPTKQEMSKTIQRHAFHLVDPSPWPIIAALSALMVTFGGALYLHGYSGGGFLWRFGVLMVLFMMFTWWRDVIREGTFEGQHTKAVQRGLRIGMLLFIVSEIMFFFAFFWAFFHSSINPTYAIGGVWPPMFLVVLDPWKIPFLNTVILLTSGATITWVHHAIVWGSKPYAFWGLVLTIGLAVIFTGLQGFEYLTSPFTISDGIYGSTFFMTTGFHGFHVFVGTCFLIVCLLRLFHNHFTRQHHFGFEAAAWYWHFVDIVWLFLFVTIYWWGS